MPSEHTLQTHYFREIMRGLLRIKASLARLKTEPACLEHIALIRDTAACLRDLAMIHGYDGVENISAKIHSTFDQIFTSKRSADVHLIARLYAGISVIQKIAELEDSIEGQMTVERISDIAEKGRQKVQDCALELSREWDLSGSLQLKLDFDEPPTGSTRLLQELEVGQPENPQARLLFDIKEFEAVLLIAGEDEETAVNDTLELF